MKTAFLFPLYLLFSPPLQAEKITFSCPQRAVSFVVQLAQTPQECARGLMNRKTLGEDEGMLFLFPNPHPVTMWMKNTPLSLDMVFMNQQGKILAIEENTVPYSLKLIGPIKGTSQVLEIQAGTVKKHAISKECVLKREN